MMNVLVSALMSIKAHHETWSCVGFKEQFGIKEVHGLFRVQAFTSYRS